MSDSNPNVGGNRRRPIVRITTTAIFTALAVGLMFLEVPLPLMPPFLKFDFSEIPVLVGTFALGPVYGIIIELLKNLIHLPWTGTMAIGEMSNFITGSIFVGTAGLIYRKNRTRKGAVISMIAATLALAVIAVPVNAFINLPLYASVLGMTMESILGWTQTVNPAIDSELKLLLLGFVPFNLFKGIVVSAITFCVYKPISKLINRTYENTKD
ncbi:MAG: ECF transporter S component [Clostridiales bacterium]|jgi:riboflavin transporter FmnP|nr:ECF transporter S component [Clostridiales bacterium]